MPSSWLARPPRATCCSASHEPAIRRLRARHRPRCASAPPTRLAASKRTRSDPLMLMRRSLAIAVFALAPWLGSAPLARADAPEGNYSLPLNADEDTIVAPSELNAAVTNLCQEDRELGQICVDLNSALSLVTGAG